MGSNIKDHEVFPDGYTIYRKDRNTGSKGGGVFIAVKDQYMSSQMVDWDTKCEILWVKLEITSCKSLYFASYYRPNANDQESLDQLAESLSKLPKNNAHVWLAGDMNLPGIEWPSGCLKENCPTPSQHIQFLEILADHGLTQITDKPTREENVLDLIVVNNPTLVNRLEVIPGISDHDAVFSELDISPKKFKQVKRKIPIYRKADWTKIGEEMRKTHSVIADQKDSRDVDHLWTTFKSGLLSATEKFVPQRACSTRDRPPWITPNVRKLMRSRNHLYKKNRAEPTASRKDKLKRLKRTINKTTKEAYWNYTETILTESDTNTNNKKLWTFVKHRKTDSIDIAPLKEKGILKDEPKDKAEILNKQFSSVFTTDSPDDFPDLKTWQKESSYLAIPEIKVSVKGVHKLLMEQNPHKAMGPDGLHPQILKRLASEIAPILQIIFQKSLDTGKVPTDWKQANVCPIYKKGERYNTANYRPVSLTCICSKFLEHIVTSHLLAHLEKNNILYNLQHGFRSKRSTESQLISFTQDVLKNLKSGKQTDVVILDFAKAFDKVSHWRLVLKLRSYGITGQINKWIENFLQHRFQRVLLATS